MAVLVLIASIIVGCLAGYAVNKMSAPEKPDEEKAQGVVGKIIDGWDDDVSKVSDGSPSQSGTRIPGYSAAYMNEGDTSLAIRVGNPKENSVGFIATVQLEDGTVLYRSPLLKPGLGLDEIPLDRTIPKGEYRAEVYYQCVLLDKNQTPLNAAVSAFDLYVN